MEVSLKVGCLPYATGKQPSISVITIGRKWTLKWWMTDWHITLHFSISNVTCTLSDQWCINNYILYEIQPTAPACRLATQQVEYDQKRKSAVAAQIVATLTILFPQWHHMSLTSYWGQQWTSSTSYPGLQCSLHQWFHLSIIYSYKFFSISWIAHHHFHWHIYSPIWTRTNCSSIHKKFNFFLISKNNNIPNLWSYKSISWQFIL